MGQKGINHPMKTIEAIVCWRDGTWEAKSFEVSDEGYENEDDFTLSGEILNNEDETLCEDSCHVFVNPLERMTFSLSPEIVEEQKLLAQYG